MGARRALLSLRECVPPLPSMLPLGWSLGPTLCHLLLLGSWQVFSNVFLDQSWPHWLQNLEPGRVSCILRT